MTDHETAVEALKTAVSALRIALDIATRNQHWLAAGIEEQLGLVELTLFEVQYEWEDEEPDA